MTEAIEAHKGNKSLHAIDPELPLLASEVAIDIENMLSNASIDLTAIRSLADKLNNSFSANVHGDALHSLMDPATLNVLNKAVAEVNSQKTLEKVEELLSEAAKIARVLSSKNPMEDPEGLRQAQQFCVAFSKATMAYHKSIYDLSPSHPYRS